MWGGGNFIGLDACGTVNVLFSQGICRTAVPVFFLISGYLFFSQLEHWNKEIWVGKIKKRIKSLLIPYLLWNLIAFIAFYLAQCVKIRGLESIVECFQEQGGFRIFWDCHSGWMPFDFPLWFMRDLMAVIVISPIIYSLVNNKKVGVASIMVFMIIHLSCVWPITKGLSSTAIMLFMIGAYLRLHGHDLLKIFKPFEILSYVLTVILLVAIVYCWGRLPIHQYLHHALQIIGTIATFNFASRLCGTRIESVGRKLSITAFWIFAIQGIYVIDLTKKILSMIIPESSSFIGIIYYFSCTAIALVLCSISFFIFNKVTPTVTKILCGSR